ncbi:MAG: hypothetical protein Kow0020_03180 [Wenzhouxiangellaceae bacterium]
MTYARVFLTVLCLICAAAAAAPDSLRSLYVGVAPAEQPDAARQALNQVLVRLTGRVGADLVQTLEIGQARAESMIVGRMYREAEQIDADGKIRRQRLLELEFDPRAVNAVLEQAGLARWGQAERPVLLVWVAVERDSVPELAEGDALLEQALDSAAFRYGLELVRPILDARDRLEVTAADIRGGFIDVALDAMRRYGAGGVVFLDLRRGEAWWSGRFTWRVGELEQSFERSGADPAEVIDRGIGRIAETLAARFAVRYDTERPVRLVVAGLQLPSQYLEVRRFLERLTGVRQVRVLGAEADRMEFEVITATHDLRSRIELAGPLQFERAEPGTGRLHYRFSFRP